MKRYLLFFAVDIMLKVNVPTESVSSVGVAKIGICNLSAESCGQARVNLPLELSLPAGNK